MSPDYVAYVRCMQELIRIKDEEKAELLRCQMNFHRPRLNESEIEAIRRREKSTASTTPTLKRLGHSLTR